MRLKRGEWLLLVLTALAYAGFMPLRHAIERRAGCAFVAPDMNFPPHNALYSAAKTSLAANDGAGRDAYLHWHLLGLDLIFPLLLGCAVALVLLRIGERLPRFAALPGKTRRLAAALVPVAYALADYGENWTVSGWLKSGDDAALGLISTLTTLKFAALALAAVIAAALNLAGLKHKGSA